MVMKTMVQMLSYKEPRQVDERLGSTLEGSGYGASFGRFIFGVCYTTIPRTLYHMTCKQTLICIGLFMPFLIIFGDLVLRSLMDEFAMSITFILLHNYLCSVQSF